VINRYFCTIWILRADAGGIVLLFRHVLATIMAPHGRRSYLIYLGEKRIMKTRTSLSALLAAVIFMAASSAAAQNYVVVAPGQEQGWTDSESTAGGDVTFVSDADAPRGAGALQLTTDATTTAKASYLHTADIALANVTDLAYSTKQVSASFPQGSASYQLIVCLDGATDTACNGFTTLVFEPYQNPTQGAVLPGVWQDWDVDAGQFWSTRTYDGAGACDVTAGGGGAPFYTLAGLQAVCPNADVVGFGVNVGSNNPDYQIRVDTVQFNDTIYDFEPFIVPMTRDQCKGMGWRLVRRADGTMFRNQGQCVAYVNHNDGRGNDDNQVPTGTPPEVKEAGKP
jgi:hypothetical protein